MRLLIGNEINTRSVTMNILNKSLPNIILLYGGYGSGKTEFAIDIARMLVCKNLTEHGFCGVCSACQETEYITPDTFMTKVSLTNMTMVNQEAILNLVRENSSVVHLDNKVYIYDEFHAVPLSSQEMWLSETRKLDNTYLILTTTKLRSIDKGIVSRAIKLKMNYVSRYDADSLLSMYDLQNTTNDLLDVLYDTFRGSPREIITAAKYCLNSGLTTEEQKEFIRMYKRAPIEDLLMSIVVKESYFKFLREICRSYSTEEIIRSTEDYIWDKITMTDEIYACQEISEVLSRENLISLLSDVKKDSQLAYINLYRRKRHHSDGDDKPVLSASLRKLTGDTSSGNSDARRGLQRW